MVFGTMTDGENLRSGRLGRNWVRSLADDFKVCRATEGSTESTASLFGVETKLGPTEVKKGGERCRRVVEWSGPFHDDMASSRGGEKLAIPRKKEHQKWRQRERGRGGKGRIDIRCRSLSPALDH